MGWGDELIATGQAKQMQESDPRRRRVLVLDKHNQVRTHDAWANNPRFVRPGQRETEFQQLINRPGARPYIAGKTGRQWQWQDFKCTPGELFLTQQERDYVKGLPQPHIVFEPHVKYKASPNKDWGWVRWNKLAYLAQRAGYRVTQLGLETTRLLEGAELVPTNNLRHACAALENATAAVLTEGGLHHSAAALGVPAVVIFGGFISPRQTGYDTQTNLFTGGEPCGMRIPCAHCRKAMDAITPEEVLLALEALMKERALEPV